jgi:type I restriction enzyme S subunit
VKPAWQTKPLKQFCEKISTGPFGSLLHKSDYVENGVPLVNPSNITAGRILPDPSTLINKAKIDELSTYVLRENDIVVGRRGEIGRCAVVGPNEAGWTCGTGSFFIRPLPCVNPDFLAHLIRSSPYRERLEAAATGTTMLNLSNSALCDLPVSIAPLLEQIRIVSILEEAFAVIAIARANTEKNLQNAKTLFNSYLESVFTTQRSTWAEKPLQTISALLSGYSFKSTDFSSQKGVKCIKITNVGVREFICESESFLPESFIPKYSAFSVKKGSIVLALTRSIVSGGLKVAIVPGEYEGALLNQRVASILATPNLLLSSYLFAYLSTERVASYVRDRVNTLMQPNLSIKDLREMPVPVPPLYEQKRIAGQISDLHEETDRLANLYSKKLAALNTLKNSLLHHAFTGNL